MKAGIVVFPGSNCDRDAYDAITKQMRGEATMLWHDERADLKKFDLIILPGGFSYGDYLRTGAIARFAPVMNDVVAFANKGGLVLGICNGFQILTECGLLPGALVKNKSLKFICDNVALKIESTDTPFTRAYTKHQLITLPVAHGEGNYTADADVIQQLEDQQRVIFRYVEDVNGSANNIAGIVNEQRNVLGLMPHPERTLWKNETFSGDGAGVFASIANALVNA